VDDLLGYFNAPHRGCARIVLTGGPFDGEQAALVPPGIAAPAQIVWSGWLPWGFDAWLYEWRGETLMDQGRIDALVYRPTGRSLTTAEIPPLVAEDVEVWADTAARFAEAFDVPAEMLWPGL
jgi:hypothetical protein